MLVIILLPSLYMKHPVLQVKVANIVTYLSLRLGVSPRMYKLRMITIFYLDYLMQTRGSKRKMNFVSFIKSLPKWYQLLGISRGFLQCVSLRDALIV